MIRRLLLALALLLAVAGRAEAAPCTIPFTFTAGTLASAAQVNSNFSTLVGCFNPIDLSASVQIQSLIDRPGSTTSPAQPYFSTVASQRWELALGSTSAPITTGGPALRITVANAYSAGTVGTQCNNQPAQTACFSALIVVNQGLGTSVANSIGIAGIATNSANGGAGINDVTGIQGIGEQLATGVGIGFGGYFQGQRDNLNALSVGAEITNYNASAVDCITPGTGAFLYDTIGQCDGIWVTSRGGGPSLKMASSAIHIGIGDAAGSQFSAWNEGITINSAPAPGHSGTIVSGVSFNDAGSGSGTVFQALGTHTYALATGALAGDFGFGTATPAARMELTGNKSAAYWGASGIAFREDAVTYSDTTSSGAASAIVVNSLKASTLTASAATTYASASTLYVENCPVAGSNVAITACYALYLGGTIFANAGITAPSLPASAGAGGINLCIDNVGVVYKKASCP